MPFNGFASGGVGLKISSEEVPLINKLAKERPNHLKNLVVVPGIAVIQSAQRITSERSGCRLFAIVLRSPLA